MGVADFELKQADFCVLECKVQLFGKCPRPRSLGGKFCGLVEDQPGQKDRNCTYSGEF